ncbi:SufD family Fe-S cluster assembly protein, partial [Candidatus Saccharibacteria bacterium]|nr:SufD family Fe-S cluster assembly protein [Candidatus Saccharibacteria bacterium]
MEFCEFGEVEKQMLKEVAGLYAVPEGAYNFRVNGKSVSRKSSSNIDVDIVDGGLVINVKPGTKNESVHIPVVLSKTGLKETVKNTFNIGENADVVIIAGCGIYNCGENNSEHNGVHILNVGKNAKVKYVEKHYGTGGGGGARILNPTTNAYIEEGAEVEMDLEQIKGVDSTIRKTTANVGKNAKLIIRERLMTHGRQTAESIIETTLAGENSAVDIVSRAVAQDLSRQKFNSHIVGEGKCRGHSECDAIIMDKAQVLAEPALDAKSIDAELVHEAAIGKIAGEQIIKLETLGLTKAEAESLI